MSAEVERSIPPGRPSTAPTPTSPDAAVRGASAPAASVVVGGLIVLGLLVLYGLSNLGRENLYQHFIWQGLAWMDGHATIPYPVPGNDYYNDVMPVLDAAGDPTGRGLLPFPPLPALVLLPFTALWGLATDTQLLTAIGAALGVAVAFWAIGRLEISRSAHVASIVFLGVGTVLWYAAAVGTTWWTAHVVALPLLFGAVGIAIARELAVPYRPARRLPLSIDPALVLAGLLLGLAATARLPVALGGIFFVAVGGGTLRGRVVSVAIGAALPLAALVAYTFVATGHPFNPAYEYLYRYEANAYPQLGYVPSWSIEDPRYIPQNLARMLLQPPNVLPACSSPGAARGLFDAACPFIVPDPVGMSLLLTSPAWLIALAAVRRRWTDPIVAGGIVASAAIATLDLMHFSQGWVQYGYRFSLDFAPFLLPVMALGLDGLEGRWRRLGYVLIGLSVIMQLWGILWRGVMGW
jgi:hypothetical protein